MRIEHLRFLVAEEQFRNVSSVTRVFSFKSRNSFENKILNFHTHISDVHNQEFDLHINNLSDPNY